MHAPACTDTVLETQPPSTRDDFSGAEKRGETCMSDFQVLFLPFCFLVSAFTSGVLCPPILPPSLLGGDYPPLFGFFSTILDFWAKQKLPPRRQNRDFDLRPSTPNHLVSLTTGPLFNISCQRGRKGGKEDDEGKTVMQRLFARHVEALDTLRLHGMAATENYFSFLAQGV